MINEPEAAVRPVHWDGAAAAKPRDDTGCCRDGKVDKRHYIKIDSRDGH